ncbi:MAG: energy-coupling factor transporter transmembrane protein EcfT, partial [Lachnospiraceae bacterium]|nr:energy-coupling factor transporter transmembrane protein EcfT [Lachnospiraceae bacterium]
MFKDVTLGQYYQADSVIHRLDPRVKLAGTFLYMISLFVFNNIFCYIVSAILLLAVIILCKIPIGYMLKGMRAVIFIMV